MAQADELIRAAVDVVASEFQEGWPRFKELKRRYRDAEWLEHLDGTPVGQMVSFPKWLVELLGERRLPGGLDWRYDSTALLEQSQVPIAWLLAGDDRSAPNEQTIATLRALMDQGKPISLTVFPDTDHGMVTFTEDGSKVTYTGLCTGVFSEGSAGAAKTVRMIGADPAPMSLHAWLPVNGCFRGSPHPK